VHQHPAVLETLVRDRVAELRYSARATGRAQRANRRPRVAAAIVRQTGWLLVDVGLRLALPRGASNHRVAGGQ